MKTRCARVATTDSGWVHITVHHMIASFRLRLGKTHSNSRSSKSVNIQYYNMEGLEFVKKWLVERGFEKYCGAFEGKCQ